MGKLKNDLQKSMPKKSFQKGLAKKAFAEDYDDGDLDEEDEVPKWYEEFPNDPDDYPEPSEELVNDLRKEAKTLLENDISTYNIKISKSSQQSNITWMKTMVTSGTTADKIAALTIMIQNSPIHSLNSLQNLINLVKIGKKECMQVIGTVTELFLADLLPPDRKLRIFAACPLTLVDKMSSGNQLSRNKHLIRWYFEDQLKQLYQEFLVHVNTAARDSIEVNKEKAIVALFKLITGNPEKESYILSSLVNKLGDPSQKVGSKTIYCLMQLLRQHPAMKGVLMEEIEKLLFRPNVSKRAQYYGICFLAQYVFSSYDGEVAKNIVKIYFSFFKSCVKKGEVDSKMMKVLLNGVNRAFPFVNKEVDDEISEHIEMLYKIVHVATFNVGLHALCLIFQVSDYNHSVSERFYNVLYKKLSDPQLATTSHHAMFFSLVYRALKKNENVSRGRVFLKRLLQECVHLPTHLACGALFLTSQIIGNNKDLLPLLNEASKFQEEEDEEDDEGECYKDAPIDEEARISLDISVEGLPSPKLESAKGEEKSRPSTWYHVDGGAGDKKTRKAVSKYVSNTRNPLHSGGEHCVYTELTKLLTHFHPSVALFASTILSGNTIRYSGDPLLDFGLMKFLDRFVFKNPKKLTVFENLKPSPFGRKKNYIAKGLKSLAINSNNYLNETANKIPVDERFLYQYLQRKRTLGKKVNAEDDEESDMESVASDEFEEMMDGLMGGQKDQELDFADDVGDKLTAKQNAKKRGSKEGDEEDEEFNDNDDGDEDDDDDDEDKEFDDEENSDDAEDIEFGSDGDDFELGDDFDINNIPGSSDEEIPSTKKKVKNKKDLLSRFQGPNNSIFASADEFAQMLEESGASGLKMSGSSSLANKDNAAEKQMKWEVSRNNWMTDEKWKSKGGKRQKGSSAPGNPRKRLKKNKKER